MPEDQWVETGAKVGCGTCAEPHVRFEWRELETVPGRTGGSCWIPGSYTPMKGLKCLIPRSRSQVEPCDFCIRRGDFSRLGVKDGQKCPSKGSNVAALMLTTPCRVSGGHPALTLFAQLLLPLVSLPLHVGLDTALFAGKYPMFT